MKQVQRFVGKRPRRVGASGPFPSRFLGCGLVADPHAPRVPAIAVPDPLPGPVAVAAVIARAGPVVITGSVVIPGAVIIAVIVGDRADDGAGGKAADDAGRDAPAARFG